MTADTGGAGPTAAARLKVGIVAGEASGDALGAGLMAALTAGLPDTEFTGVGGPAMLAAGLHALAPMDTLQVNGFREPVLRLPSLVRLFNALTAAFVEARIDVFVGVDFNVFNLLLERRLKRAGIRTVHYVSPSVYAWRRGRVKRIGRSADLVLTLYPFEPELYRGHGIGAVCVGHPLADRIDFEASGEIPRRRARDTLGLPGDAPVVALLPGSRMSEIRLHAEIFLDTAALFAAATPGARFVVPCVTSGIRETLEARIAARQDLPPCVCYEGDASRALTACDIALVKSGTSTLEAMLLKRPMVVTYRLGALTYHVVSRLLRTPYVALPNILAGRMLVPELLQYDGTPERLATALRRVLTESADGALREQFDAIHHALRKNANVEAANAVFALLGGAYGTRAAEPDAPIHAPHPADTSPDAMAERTRVAGVETKTDTDRTG